MTESRKVFCVGLSKTGTTTLAECFKILGLTPCRGSNRRMKQEYRRTGDAGPALTAAKDYVSLKGGPWNRLYRELDEAFPGSKFILTVRASSELRVRSSWAQKVRKGLRRGEMDEKFSRRTRNYEAHNEAVIKYFEGRPDALLVVCWENGDGWQKLCEFLGVEVPGQPIPHLNAQSDDQTRPSWLRKLEGTYLYMKCRRAKVVFRKWRKERANRVRP